jgi:hypothetical protein
MLPELREDECESSVVPVCLSESLLRTLRMVFMMM